MITQTIGKIERKNFAHPDETRIFENGKLEIVTVGETTFGRATLKPGWRWSTSVKPLVNTEYCEAGHLQYQVSGRLQIRMEDGSELVTGAGDVVSVPPGHDAWVLGMEPVVLIDITGMRDYAKH